MRVLPARRGDADVVQVGEFDDGGVESHGGVGVIWQSGGRKMVADPARVLAGSLGL
jgi:hypothetical protein